MQVIRQMYPANKGPTASIPASGPAPVLMRWAEWFKVGFCKAGTALQGQDSLPPCTHSLSHQWEDSESVCCNGGSRRHGTLQVKVFAEYAAGNCW